MLWFLLASLVPLAAALQWSDSLTNNTVMTVCSSSDIQLLWNFTLSPEEHVEDIKWVYQAEGGSEELIAVYVVGHFNPMPAYTGRVQWTGQAGIVVTQAAVAESGNYSVVVSTADVAHPLVTFTKSATVQIADPPTAETGKLQVRQQSEAVYDNTTSQWRVQLTCGVLISPGQPAVNVIWTTPEGHILEDSSEDNGTFRLLLPNPPSGGNYTCTLPPLSPATNCLPPLSPLLEGATVTVDQVKASFTLLEARQREMEAKTKAELESVRSENADLKKEVGTLRNETALLKAIPCSCSVQRVSFHAYLFPTFTGSGILQPFHVITNEGQAFNGTSGVMTVPVNGTYFFVASAGTFSADKYVDLFLQKDGLEVSWALARQNAGYYSMGSVQATLRLTKGQRVLLYSANTNGYYSNLSTSFTGFLIHADL